MGIEYYLLKPDKKELFYLGKHFYGFDKIPSATYGKEADYPKYEDWDDFFWSVLRENWDYFMTMEVTLAEVNDIIYKIYDWSVDSKVILANDCQEDAASWLDWKETESIITILEEIHGEKERSEDGLCT